MRGYGEKILTSFAKLIKSSRITCVVIVCWKKRIYAQQNNNYDTEYFHISGTPSP